MSDVYELCVHHNKPSECVMCARARIRELEDALREAIAEREKFRRRVAKAIEAGSPEPVDSAPLLKGRKSESFVCEAFGCGNPATRQLGIKGTVVFVCDKHIDLEDSTGHCGAACMLGFGCTHDC